MFTNYKPDWIDVDEGKMNSEAYFSALRKALPEIEKILDSEQGLHYNMELFAAHTIEKLERGRLKEFRHCLQFQDDQFDNLNTELENAIYVSYLETLYYEINPAKLREALKLFPNHLRKALIDTYVNSQ